MSFTMKNSKGLSASCVRKVVATEQEVLSLEKWAGNCVGKESEAARKLSDALRRLPADAATGSMVVWIPSSGWTNESAITKGDDAEAAAGVSAAGPAAAAWKAAAAAEKKGAPMPAGLSSLKTAGAAGLTVEEAGPRAFAKEGTGWAVWMEHGKGYMDDRKNPAGLSAARMFESEAGAERTARSAGFGNGRARGPAALVKVAVEPVEILAQRGSGFDTNDVKYRMAEREGREIAAAMDGVDDTRDEAEKDEGCSFGMALWNGEGFMNHRGGPGPLAGAQLRDIGDRTAWWWSGAQVKVRLRPVTVGARLGDAPAAVPERDVLLAEATIRRGALKKAEETGLVPQKARRRL